MLLLVQVNYQLQNLLISQDGLQTRDEVHNTSAGVRDTLIPFQLAKWAFLTFLVAGQHSTYWYSDSD